MKIKLSFNEAGIRSVLNERYDDLSRQSIKKFNKKAYRSLILLIAGLFPVFFFYQYPQWIGLTVMLWFLSLINFMLPFADRIEFKKSVRKSREQTEECINRYKTVTDPTYIFEEEQIKYFENGDLMMIRYLTDLIHIYAGPEHIYLFFKKEKDRIWIPQNCLTSEDFQMTKKWAEEMRKTL